jgi:hypothetical protein
LRNDRRRAAGTGRLVKALLVSVALTVAGAIASAQSLEGRWEGSLQVNDTRLRLVIDVTTTEDDVHLATLTSPDQGGAELAVDVMEMDGNTVTFEIRAIGATFLGELDETQRRITGAWDQGVPLPLDLVRAGETRPERARAGAPTAPVQAAPEPFGPQLHVDAPFVPPAFAADGAMHLAWELHLSNFGANPMAIRRIEVLGVASDGEEELLARFERAELNALLRPVGGGRVDAGAADRAVDLRVLAPGRRSVAYLWLRIADQGAVPERLSHRIFVRDQVFRVADVEVPAAAYEPLAAPLAGTGWLAVNGPGNSSVHRRGLLTVEGGTYIAQRFAADWVRVDEAGRTFDGDAEHNDAYFAYGEEVIAAADSTVVAIRDDIPENVPGLMSRAVPVTLDTLAGNYVVLDLHDGRYAFYAHLQTGSVAVQPGQRVQRGAVLGRVGNSGNSTEPHLHFHVANGPTLASEGVPYTFERFELHRRDGSPQSRRAELPLHNMLVSFPARR